MRKDTSGRVPRYAWWLAGVVLVMIGAAAGVQRLSSAPQSDGASAEILLASRDPAPDNPESDGEASIQDTNAAKERFPVTIRQPSGPPVIELESEDPHGRGATVACSTCHSVREPNFETRATGDLNLFHQGLKFAHGDLSCYSCHNPSDTDTLRLADSTPVEYVNVMKLCSQCHGPQARDYAHGAHGGMTGYWDLNRGPRTRNNCVDCHDPHAPQFPAMVPTFKPRDRFLPPHTPPQREALGE